MPVIYGIITCFYHIIIEKRLGFWMLIIGVDPGIAIVGWGILDYTATRFTTIAYGAITTPANTPVPDRLLRIADELSGLIGRFKPQDMAVEELFFNTNQKTAISVAEARGVILLCARRGGLYIGEYTPLQVKQAVVGYGRAEKHQVMEMTRKLLGLEQIPRPDDTADALAIAICHAHSKKMNDIYGKT